MIFLNQILNKFTNIGITEKSTMLSTIKYSQYYQLSSSRYLIGIHIIISSFRRKKQFYYEYLWFFFRNEIFSRQPYFTSHMSNFHVEKKCITQFSSKIEVPYPEHMCRLIVLAELNNVAGLSNILPPIEKFGWIWAKSFSRSRGALEKPFFCQFWRSICTTLFNSASAINRHIFCFWVLNLNFRRDLCNLFRLLHFKP